MSNNRKNNRNLKLFSKTMEIQYLKCPVATLTETRAFTLRGKYNTEINIAT